MCSFIQKLYKVVIGIVAVFFLSYALIDGKNDILLLPSMQLIMGLVIATMLVSGVSAFRNKNKKLGSFYTIVTLFMLIAIIFNNTMTLDGLIPVIGMSIVCTVPIGIIAMIFYRLENKSKLR